MVCLHCSYSFVSDLFNLSAPFVCLSPYLDVRLHSPFLHIMLPDAPSTGTLTQGKEETLNVNFWPFTHLSHESRRREPCGGFQCFKEQVYQPDSALFSHKTLLPPLTTPPTPFHFTSIPSLSLQHTHKTLQLRSCTAANIVQVVPRRAVCGMITREEHARRLQKYRFFTIGV